MPKKIRPLIITARRLYQLGACDEQQLLFQKLFGERVSVTPELVRKHGPKFDVWWLMGYMLSNDEYERISDEVLKANAKDDAALTALRQRWVYTKAGEYRARPCWRKYDELSEPIYRRMQRRTSRIAWREFINSPTRETTL